MSARARRTAAALAAACLAACSTGPDPIDPTVVVRTDAGDALGVSTDYGVVFLGQGAQSGTVRFEIRFGDGPSLEAGVVEPLGAGLYTTAAEIRVPSVPLSFRELAAGETVTVLGRRGRESWVTRTEVVAHPSIDGLLLELDGALRDLGPDQVGAGVYVDDGPDRRLVGLVSGRLAFQGREYATVVGADELWRVVTQRRNRDRAQPHVYRDDID